MPATKERSCPKAGSSCRGSLQQRSLPESRRIPAAGTDTRPAARAFATGNAESATLAKTARFFRARTPEWDNLRRPAPFLRPPRRLRPRRHGRDARPLRVVLSPNVPVASSSLSEEDDDCPARTMSVPARKRRWSSRNATSWRDIPKDLLRPICAIGRYLFVATLGPTIRTDVSPAPTILLGFS